MGVHIDRSKTTSKRSRGSGKDWEESSDHSTTCESNSVDGSSHRGQSQGSGWSKGTDNFTDLAMMSMMSN